MLVKYDVLLHMPDGILFCEHDLPAMPVFKKVERVDNDILVEALFKSDDGGPYRYGFDEMDAVDRNSIEFYILNARDIDMISSMLNSAKKLEEL